MSPWFRRWAPVLGALFVAVLTLTQGIWRRSPTPVERTGMLLDTYVRVVAVDGRRTEGVEAALASLRESEGLLNRYDPASTVAQINQAAGQWAGLDPLTLEVLHLVRSAEPAVDGAFDIALGQVIDLYPSGWRGVSPPRLS